MAREEQRRAVVEEETLKMPQQGWEVDLVSKGFGEGTPMCRDALRFLSPAIPIVSEPRTPSSPSLDHTEEGTWAREVQQ